MVVKRCDRCRRKLDGNAVYSRFTRQHYCADLVKCGARAAKLARRSPACA